MKIVTRFPPSPTGNLHIGGARTALFNFLFTRHHKGKMYLRLENTDEERSKKEYEENILDALKWLGLSFDPLPDGSPFWRQSERKDVYRAHLKRLIEEGKAYHSRETEGKREKVIRFRNPNKRIAFTDLIRGDISFDTTELGDFVMAKSEEEPLYHLAVVIDDHEMGITHVIRGEDHISNTPRQILLQEALGFTRPEYAHIPLILAPDRSKLSKRHGAVAVTEYRGKGFLPQALVNYLALLGWNPGGDREIFSLEEFTSAFDFAKVHKGGAIFDEAKLRAINREYLKKTFTPDDLKKYIPDSYKAGKNTTQIQTLAQTLFERIHTFADIENELQSELVYLHTAPAYEREQLYWPREVTGSGDKIREIHTYVKENLKEVMQLIEKTPETNFSVAAIGNTILPFAKEKGKGNVLWPMRYALSGKERSPDPFTLAAILGKEETIKRLAQAVTMLK